MYKYIYLNSLLTFSFTAPFMQLLDMSFHNPNHNNPKIQNHILFKITIHFTTCEDNQNDMEIKAC